MGQENLKFESGDIIAFAEATFPGFVAKKIAKWPINHVGIMIDSKNMIESVIIEGVRIIAAEDLFCRAGEKYFCRLNNESREKFDLENFNNFIEKVKGKEYDYFQATLLAIDKFIHPISFKEDHSKIFCNELVAGALKAAKILDETVNTVKLTPPDIFYLPIFSEKMKID
ncbi:MAG: hypothetical protein ACD_20C00174G0012 [uncultured bacterium]|nr:MAG: hypothetical protein ACD_20C00174G0012 [uncultured bacterium]